MLNPNAASRSPSPQTPSNLPEVNPTISLDNRQIENSQKPAYPNAPPGGSAGVVLARIKAKSVMPPPKNKEISNTQNKLKAALVDEAFHAGLVEISLEHIGEVKESVQTKRAGFPLDCYKALGGSAHVEEVAAIGTSLALAHEAFLIIDDIQDNDTERRGKPTAWVRHGVPQALNASLFVLSRAINEMNKISLKNNTAGPLIVQRYMDGIAQLTKGQAIDEEMSRSGKANLDQYFEAAGLKNGTALALSVELPALLLGHSLDEARQIGKIFENVGVLHQITNDMEDVVRKDGRPAGQDLYEGKGSVVAIVYQREAPEDAERFTQFLQKPRSEKSDDEVKTELQRIIVSGTPQKLVEISEAKARQTIKESTQLDQYPELQKILKYLVEKKVKKLHQCVAEC